MGTALAREVAESLDCPPELLPEAVRLFAGLDALGSEPETLASAMRVWGDELKDKMFLELGCGFGAPGRALARECGVQVLGVDAMSPFIDEARRRADAAGVADRCRYRLDDLRRMLSAEGRFDGVLWLAMGQRLGDLRDTLRQLRRLVKPGGWVVIQHDSRQNDGSNDPSVVRAALTAFGDELAREVSVPHWQVREADRARHRVLREAGESIASEDPFRAAMVMLFLERQERAASEGPKRETTMWVLRRRESAQAARAPCTAADVRPRVPREWPTRPG